MPHLSLSNGFAEQIIGSVGAEKRHVNLSWQMGFLISYPAWELFRLRNLKLERIATMKPSTVPSSREELNALPEYNGPDAENVYSERDLLDIILTDDKNQEWWLLRRPNGSYCKAKVED